VLSTKDTRTFCATYDFSKFIVCGVSAWTRGIEPAILCGGLLWTVTYDITGK